MAKSKSLMCTGPGYHQVRKWRWRMPEDNLSIADRLWNSERDRDPEPVGHQLKYEGVRLELILNNGQRVFVKAKPNFPQSATYPWSASSYAPPRGPQDWA